jgi:ketosteroid isomerase-like protein
VGDLAWLVDELDIARPPAKFRYAMTQLATFEGGTWTVRAMHRAILVLDRTANELAKIGALPVPAALRDRGRAPEVAAAFRAAFSSRPGFIAAISDRADAINVGSAPGQYIRGGARIRSTFERIAATFAIRDGVVVGQLTDTAGFGAANVDYTIERGGQAVTETFRVLAAFAKEPAGWTLVVVQWSNGGPLPVIAPDPR